MTDPTTPTDQPSELDAIRARVDEIEHLHTRADLYLVSEILKAAGYTCEIRDDEEWWSNGGVWSSQADAYGMLQFKDMLEVAKLCRRLIALVEERGTPTPTDQPSELDAIRARAKLHGPTIGGLGIFAFQAHRDRSRLLELLDERDTLPSDEDSEIESLRRELAEAREKALEECLMAGEKLMIETNYSGKTTNYFFERFISDYMSIIRSLKQPNQIDL